jgi:hypothetical protein
MPQTKIAALIANVFGTPPLMLGEDPAEYEKLKEAGPCRDEPEHLAGGSCWSATTFTRNGSIGAFSG